MPPVNNFLPFCATDTGSNLLTEAEYTASADRTSGNKPGVASSKLNNRALRQSAAITSQLAQFIADKTGTDVLDDAVSAKLLAQINAAMKPFAPLLTEYKTPGSTTHNLTYIFAIASGSATIGATYTNNGVTYTVSATIASGTFLTATGSGAPLVAGTLTKSGGTGDSTLTFYAVRAPLYLRVRAAGGGGGGKASGTGSPGAGADGGDTSFGTTLIVCSKGIGSTSSDGSAGGAATYGTGPIGVAFAGTSGGYASNVGGLPGGSGGQNFFGGGAQMGAENQPGHSAIANTGGGGAGAGTAAASIPGGGGGAGGFVDVIILNPLSTYACIVGAGGAGGTAGGSGFVGGNGASGIVEVTEYYQ